MIRLLVGNKGWDRTSVSSGDYKFCLFGDDLIIITCPGEITIRILKNLRIVIQTYSNQSEASRFLFPSPSIRADGGLDVVIIGGGFDKSDYYSCGTRDQVAYVIQHLELFIASSSEFCINISAGYTSERS